MYQETMTQALSVIDVINLTNNNNTNSNSIGVDMSKFKRLLFIIAYSVGAGNIDGRLQSAATSAFSTTHNITGTNITTLTVNNTLTTVEVRADQVTNANAGDKFVRLQLTVSVGATNVQAVGLGSESEQLPASQYNLNTTFLTAGTVCNI